MKVMVFVKATESSEAGVITSTELFTAMMAFNEELARAGILLAGEGLKPTREAVRVKFSGAERSVQDGPFAETKELVAGYWLWEVDSMEHAIEWVKRCPNPMPEESEIEIRPLYQMEDFGDVIPAEVIEQEARLRAETNRR
ncbi:MAG: YciI family protein [Bdellovibrionales bacterium]|nr:YciI family protein [Bdellovibrionales bacterium]